jgi:YebC/PmpR family DNA-binding regulatory protein
MAGHSHWANIAFKKGIVDRKRGKLFGKLARYIIVAARRGGGDPAANLALRYAIDRAKKASMPNDTIDRAVKKGTGELATETYDEVLYEGYGPHGVAILCEILTENRNRTARASPTKWFVLRNHFRTFLRRSKRPASRRNLPK